MHCSNSEVGLFIVIYYAIRQQIKYNGIQLKHGYKIYGRLTV